MQSVERERKSIIVTISGLIINLFLAVIKLTFGFLTLSNALIADGANNASDSLSSFLTLFSLKLSNRKPNRKHPFGYHRVEYIFSLIISVMVIFVGVEILKDSITTILAGNNQLEITLISVIMVGISIILKLIQYFIYKIAARKLNSMELKVLKMDSLMDVIVTSAILVSSIVFITTKFDLDIYLSIVVGVFIIYNGISLSISAINPLIGIIPDKQKIIKIIKDIKATHLVLGVHDIIVHSYGYHKTFMTIHVEVDEHTTLIKSHGIADEIEERIRKDYDIELLVHIDPIEIANPLIIKIKESIKAAIIKINLGAMDFHEVRIVHPFEQTHKVVFDLVVPPEVKESYTYIINALNNQFSQGEAPFKAIINAEENFFE
jgi:cation diffusion facilitator family transporter